MGTHQPNQVACIQTYREDQAAAQLNAMKFNGQMAMN